MPAKSNTLRFTFENVNHILDFQFLTDSSGIILDKDGSLYSFINNEIELIESPKNFKVTHFHFIDKNHGAIVGSSYILKEEIRTGLLWSDGCISFLLLFSLLFLCKHIKKSRRFGVDFALVLMMIWGVVSCSNNWQIYRYRDPNSMFLTHITNKQLHQASFHHFPVNKNQTSFISITKNGGEDWSSHQIPTNFYPTDLISVGQNFFVSTFANEKEGDIPIHGDGDIYIYGDDTIFNKHFKNNDFEKPYSISLSRGIKGLRYYPNDSLLFVFGTERMPKWPKDEVSMTDGNIFQIHANLEPCYKIIDVPDSVAVQSLSRTGNGDLWVTLENRKLHKVDGKAIYSPLEHKRLLLFKNGDWRDVAIHNTKSFVQVEFISGTEKGYLIAESKVLFETKNGGRDWRLTELVGIEKMQSWNNSIALLKGRNTLMLYDFH